MASNTPFKKKKVEYVVDENTVKSILDKKFKTEKKPKKFTLKGLTELIDIEGSNPLLLLTGVKDKIDI